MKALLALIAAPVLVAGAPNSMSVAAFLEKADALEARGALAVFSPETKLLQRESQAAFIAWAQQARPPVACPPKGKKFQGDAKDFLAMMRAVPVNERSRISVRETFRREWNSRYPCR